MKEIPDSKVPRWRIHVAYLIAIVCATSFTWFMTDALMASREFGLKSHIRCIHFMLNEYVWQRSQSGKWPKASDIYDTDFYLKSSDDSGGVRVDTFSAKGPDMWLQFQLGQKGEITFDVSWKGPEFDSPSILQHK